MHPTRFKVGQLVKLVEVITPPDPRLVSHFGYLVASNREIKRAGDLVYRIVAAEEGREEIEGVPPIPYYILEPRDELQYGGSIVSSAYWYQLRMLDSDTNVEITDIVDVNTLLKDL